MQIKKAKLAGLQLIIPDIYRDERGFFFESYREELYVKAGIGRFVQDNISYSKQNTLRGLHFQSDPGQAKLVSCLQGKIWDVAVDVRPHSPTFLQWEAFILEDQTQMQLYIPVGFAHGFCTLSSDARVAYKVSSPYNPKTERSIRWNDPELAISWPIQHPLLSPRDQMSPYFQELRDVVDHRK